MWWIMSLQKNFCSGKPLLQIIIKEAGHKCYFLLKFHCELNSTRAGWSCIHSLSRIFVSKSNAIPGMGTLADGNFLSPDWKVTCAWTSWWVSCQHNLSIFPEVLELHGCLQVWLDSHFNHLVKSHPLAARVSMLKRQSLLSGNTALTGGLGHWWWWVWVFLIIQYSSFTLQILKWLDTAVWGGWLAL